jgi:hypothetical protein
MREIEGCQPDRLLLDELLASGEPCVLRGLIANWAITRASHYWWSTLPENEKRAWKQVFDYYVFGRTGLAGELFPELARGIFGQIDDDQARHIRAMLINKLNR